VPLRRSALACVVCACAAAAASARGGGVEQVLRGRFGMSASQVAAVRRGRPVAVALPGTVDREIQVGGAIHVGTSADRLAALLHDVERLESGEGFIHTRRLSDPPRLSDFENLRLSPEDIAALRTCRPGHCDVKLGQGAFDRLARMDWTAQDLPARVNELARSTALDYIDAYRKGGNAELAIYIDSSRPTWIATEFADLVGGARLWPGLLRPLEKYLLAYPVIAPPAGASEFFYWSMAEFGLKPVIRLNHVVVFPTGQADGLRYVVAVKQLYASHYFHTALEIRAVVADDAGEGDGATLVILNMARSDGLTGMFGGLVKSKARSGSREGLERALAAIRMMAESTAR
jgi:hypothetical protein